MDTRALFAFTRQAAVSPSRRDILRGLAGAGVGLGGAWLPAFVKAKKKGKHKNKRCAKRGQTPKKRKRCCKGLSKDRSGRCAKPCDVCQPAGACRYDSVQAAIDAATPGATVTLCAGTFKETLEIAKSLTLIGKGDGAGPGNTILDGAGAGTVVFIGEGSTVTLQHLRVTGGNVTGGGGIFNRGTLALTGCTVSGNTATVIGGGIVNLATIKLIDSTVSGNTAPEGGGIDNFQATLELIDSRVTANTAGYAAGGIRNEGTVICRGDSTVSGNTAGAAGSENCFDVGGGTGCAICPV